MSADHDREGRRTAALFAAHSPALSRFLSRLLGSPEMAADIAQESFARLLGMTRTKPVQDERGLLFTIAANLARDHLRQRARRPEIDIDQIAWVLPSDTASPEAAFDSRRRLELLRQAIGELPPRSREVFLLFRLDGLSYRQIADRLGISPRTVEYHIQHALAFCHRRLRGRPPYSTPPQRP